MFKPSDLCDVDQETEILETHRLQRGSLGEIVTAVEQAECHTSLIPSGVLILGEYKNSGISRDYPAAIFVSGSHLGKNPLYPHLVTFDHSKNTELNGYLLQNDIPIILKDYFG